MRPTVIFGEGNRGNVFNLLNQIASGMERAANLSVVPYAGTWSDLGDWQAIWREGKADETGVVTSGPSTAIDCKNMLLKAPSETQELVALGLEDIIAVAMPDAVLIAHRDRAQDVKITVNKLKEKGATLAETLPRDYRPWGWYEIPRKLVVFKSRIFLA